jgi:hypothetical protein
MFRSRLVLLGALGLIVGLLSCGRRAQDPVVIALDGRTVPVSELAFEYDRIVGIDQWAKASPEARRKFVETYANKELMVRHAEKLYGPELTGRERIIFDRWYEKLIVPRYWKDWRERIPLRPEVADSLRAVLKEERFLRQFVSMDEDLARQVYERVRAGDDLESIGKEVARQNSDRSAWADVGWALRTRLADPVAAVLFDRLTRVGEVGEPARTERYGWHVIQLHGIRPADPAELEAEVDRNVRRICRGTAVSRHAEEITRKNAFRVVDASLAPLMRHFAEMYDSLNHRMREVAVDFQGLNPPVERFTAAELALPLVTWSGGTMTTGDFLESLRKIDLDFWPTTGDTAKIRMQIERRLDRLGQIWEAEAAKTADAPDIRADMRRKRQELYLDRFHRDHLEVYGRKITDEDVTRYWEKSGDAYRSRDLVAYGFLRFPPEAKDLATKTYNSLLGGTEWGMAATYARRADPNVLFEPRLDATDGPPYPEVTALAQKYDVKPDGSPTITEPLELGSDWVILRITFRARPETLTFENAKPYVRSDLQRLAMEDTLRLALEDLKKTLGLKINWNSIK